MTKQIRVGSVAVGAGAPVAIQSMCNTNTADVAATVAQILALEQAGCEIIRVAVPDMEAAAAIGAIKQQIHIPLVARSRKPAVGRGRSVPTAHHPACRALKIFARGIFPPPIMESLP